MGDRLNHRPNELSGGQQQRVAIARALVNEPAIILADEPTGNLDSKSGAEIMQLFAELHGQGLTIVMVTHDPDIAAACKRIVHIKDGKIFKDERVYPAFGAARAESDRRAGLRMRRDGRAGVL